MSERELFELTEVFKERCEGLIFNNGKYEFDRNIEGLSQMKMAILGLSLTVVNSAWHGWQASTNRQGYKLVPVDELLRKVQNIRALNTGEYASDEIEENVCEIESMIGACDD